MPRSRLARGFGVPKKLSPPVSLIRYRLVWVCCTQAITRPSRPAPCRKWLGVLG